MSDDRHTLSAATVNKENKKRASDVIENATCKCGRCELCAKKYNKFVRTNKKELKNLAKIFGIK